MWIFELASSLSMWAMTHLVPGAYICLIVATQMPGEEYFKIEHDVVAFFHPFPPAVPMLRNLSTSTRPVSHLNLLLYPYTL